MAVWYRIPVKTTILNRKDFPLGYLHLDPSYRNYFCIGDTRKHVSVHWLQGKCQLWANSVMSWISASNRRPQNLWGSATPIISCNVPFLQSTRPVFMMTSSNGNIFRVTGPLCGEFTGPGEFPAQRPVTRSFDVFFDLRPNKRLSKQPWGWWFETPSWSLWRQCNELSYIIHRVVCPLQGWGEVQAMVPRYRYRYLGVGQVQVQVHDFSKVPRYRYRYSWKVPRYRYRYFVWWCH